MAQHRHAISCQSIILFMHRSHISVSYQEYRNLDSKIKKSKIEQAKQSQQFRKPNPQGIHEFQQYSFIDFQVDEGENKIKLQTYRYFAKGEPIGVIFMFHGLNSYIGHGAHLAAFFSQRGFTTVGFDYRGFGRSEGRQGYVQNLESHLSDCRKFISLVMPLYENLPKFGLGLSMGGMTVYYLTLENPNLFDGSILMAPALKNNLSGALVKLTGILGSLLPNKTKLTKPVYGKACKNPAITEFIKQDKYAFSERMSLSTIQMIVQTMEKSPKTFSSYKAPFMVVQGGVDKLVNPEVAFELYEKSQTSEADKSIVFFQNMWHDIWHEEEIQQILPIVVDWMIGRINKKKDQLSGPKQIPKDNIESI